MWSNIKRKCIKVYQRVKNCRRRRGSETGEEVHKAIKSRWRIRRRKVVQSKESENITIAVGRYAKGGVRVRTRERALSKASGCEVLEVGGCVKELQQSVTPSE